MSARSNSSSSQPPHEPKSHFYWSLLAVEVWIRLGLPLSKSAAVELLSNGLKKGLASSTLSRKVLRIGYWGFVCQDSSMGHYTLSFPSRIQVRVSSGVDKV